MSHTGHTSPWCLESQCPPSLHQLVQPEGRLRHVIRALLGAFSGAILFLGISHNLPLTLQQKISTGAIFTAVCAAAGVCSSFVRCSLLLPFPMMLGSRGRSYLLLLLLGLLHSGPVQNIQMNVEASAMSLSCNLDLQLNHSRLLWRQTIQPYISVAEEMMRSTAQFTDEQLNVSRTFQNFREDLMHQYGAEPSAADGNSTQQQIRKNTMSQCDSVVQGAVSRCSDWFDSKWRQCLSTVSVPVLNQVLCVPMKFSFLCDILRVMTPWCRDRIPLEGNVGALWEQLNRSMNQFQEEFRASVVLEEEEEQDFVEGLDTEIFTKAVRDSISKLRAGSDLVLNVLDTAKSFTFLSVIFSSFSYLLRYKRDLRFDNIYVTKYFRRIEARRRTQGKRRVLPLPKPERGNYIDPCSLWVHPQEASQLLSGLVTAVSLGLLTLALVGLDLVLFHVLEIVSRNTITTFNITGQREVSIRVDGESIMAQLLRTTVSAFNSSALIDIDSSNAACAVTPTVLPHSVYFSCGACVLAVALFSVLQIYSSRLRRVIASAFHPEREKRRVLFLYNLLLQRTRTCPDSNRKGTKRRLNVSCGRCFSCCRREDPENQDVQYEEN